MDSWQDQLSPWVKMFGPFKLSAHIQYKVCYCIKNIKLNSTNRITIIILMLSGPSMEIQHDVSYKSNFMAAVRLWRKQDEEKKVCYHFIFTLPCINLFFINDAVKKCIWCREFNNTVWLYLDAAPEGGSPQGGPDPERQVHPFQPDDCQVSRGPYISPWEKNKGRIRHTVKQRVSVSDWRAERRDKNLERSGTKHYTLWALPNPMHITVYLSLFNEMVMRISDACHFNKSLV